MLSPLTIVSPLSGNIWPLERIPDPVFAQKIVGDGLSIDPTDGLLLATCDGEVVSVHPAGHAVTLRTPQGLEILMHVGIDTVTLHGEGFHPRSKPGDKVRTGTPLIEFDLDFLATHAKSLLTQIVLTQTERITSWDRSTGHVRAGKDTLFTVTFAKEEPASGANGAKTFTSRAVLIPNKHGLHARPSAVLANLAKTFTSTSIIQCGEKHANARSVTAIMALEAGCGDKVQI
jgi:phosphotransferase system HPr (HPr) family protein